MVTRSLAALITLAAVAGLSTGCYYRPSGSLMPTTGEAQTYLSTETLQKTVAIIDVRTGETVFAMDIPPGKQLTLQFIAGGGDNATYTPDLMKYQVFDAGTTTGSLNSAMSVPNAASRRIDMTVRQNIEYGEASAGMGMKGDRPDWWTREGGTYPSSARSTTLYDD